ncbi:phage tail protein [Bacillus toyonensis]|uniref:phage tail family protein n=1 Tax=Bacillus toyonensis TaxID=155322 RepID=UPI000BEFC182|nr:phage tail family protein [Bacillus toyonensis]PEL75419.1 phage tail protein [Bacillus toyonensis]
MEINKTLGTIVKLLNGTVYDLDDMGIETRDFNPSAPSPKHSYEEMEGSHGEIDLGTVYGPRKINCSFYLKAADMLDYALFRDKVFNIFDSRQAFYIIDKRNPGKQWLVKCASDYEIDQQRVYGFFDIEFKSSSPFAESIGTTLDQFTYSTTTFSIYNAGDTPLDPRRMPLLITFKGASSKLKIKNKTTGDEWSYTGTTSTNDTIRLDQVRFTKNSLSIVRDTNKKLISLNVGFNYFEITGTTGAFSISFDFRFYYL